MNGNINEHDFWKYSWHDADIEKIEMSSNQITITVQHDEYAEPIKILCSDVLGLTDLCMWQDTIIFNATLKKVTQELPSFLQQVKNAYSYEESIYKNPPIKDNLLCLSVELVNDIAFHIYCYDVEIVE